MITAYAIGCSPDQLDIFRKTLSQDVQVRSIEPEDLSQATPRPNLTIVGWKGDDLSREEASMQLLGRVRAALPGGDVPIVLLVQPVFVDDAKGSPKLSGASPLDVTRDMRFINPFIESTMQVIKTMARKEVSRKEIFMKKDQEIHGDITGVIGVTGKCMEGTVSVTLSEELAHDIVRNMLDLTGVSDPLSHEDVRDGVGEVLNMIAGGAKASLSAYHGTLFRLAIPTIVSGKGLEVGHKPGTPCLVIVFDVEGRGFTLQVAFSANTC